MSKWEMVRLGDVGNFKSGGTPSRTKPEYFAGNIPWITTVALGNKYLTETDAVEFISEDAVINSATKIIAANSIMIGVRVGVGKISINKVPMCTSQDIISIENIDDRKFDKLYLVYCINSFQNHFNSKKRGATIQGINSAVLKSVKLPLPPLAIQQQIASTLDTAAALLALRKQQLAELDALIQSVFIDMFGDPVVNEKGWEKRRLSKCCIVNPKKSEIDYFTDEFEISFVSMPYVSEKGAIDTSVIRPYSEVKTGFTYFYEHDVLFAKITPCMENGKGAIAKNLKNNIGFGSTEFHVLRSIKDVSNSEWLFRLTTLQIFRKNAERNMSGSAGQKRVPTSFFNQFIIGLPPIQLQTKFATIVEKIEQQKTLVQQAIDETQTLFDSLMAEYFE